MDRFRQSVGGVAFAALLTTMFLIGSVWDEQDRGTYAASPSR
jgi:hypothetical protein